jgi:hypothetical protein
VLARCDALDGAVRRHGAGHARLPGRLRPRPRRAHLHQRARRQLPRGRRRRPPIAGLFAASRSPPGRGSTPPSRTTRASRPLTGRSGSSTPRRPAMPARSAASGRCRRRRRRASTAAPSCSPPMPTRCWRGCRRRRDVRRAGALVHAAAASSTTSPALRRRGAKVVMYQRHERSHLLERAQRRGLRGRGAAAAARRPRASPGSISCRA